MSIMIYII